MQSAEDRIGTDSRLHKIPRGAAWTLQQLRETTGFERRYDYLLHDRDSIFGQHLDESVKKLGIKALKSRKPPACQAHPKHSLGLRMPEIGTEFDLSGYSVPRTESGHRRRCAGNVTSSDWVCRDCAWVRLG